MRNPFTNCSQNSPSRTTGVGPAIQMDQKAAIIGTLTLYPYTNNHTLENSLSSLLLTAVVWTGSIVVTSNFIQK